MAAKKKSKAKRKTVAKKSAPKKRKAKVDTDLQFVGVVALAAALAVFFWKGPDAFIWYGMPAVVGIALLYEAYK